MKPSRTTIDVGGVLSTGRELVVREAIPLPAFVDFRFAEPVATAFAIRRVGRGIEVSGSIDGAALGECARCLEPVTLPVHVEVDEQLDQAGDAGPLGDNNIWTGDDLDLADLVRQSIDSALPIVLLCRDDCAGLCPDCGNKRDGACRCATSENVHG